MPLSFPAPSQVLDFAWSDDVAHALLRAASIRLDAWRGVQTDQGTGLELLLET